MSIEQKIIQKAYMIAKINAVRNFVHKFDHENVKHLQKQMDEIAELLYLLIENEDQLTG